MHRIGVASRHVAIAGAIAAALLASACSAAPGARVNQVPPPRSGQVSAELSSSLPATASAEESALLSAARSALPRYFTRKEASRAQKESVDRRTLEVKIRVDRNSRGRPERFDPQKPVLPQLEPWAPPWTHDRVDVDVATPDGTLVGTMVLERRGTMWSATTGGYDYGLQAELAFQRAEAEGELVKELGGSVDETASVDGWLLGRKGTREAGIVPWTPDHGQMAGRVYSGAELASRFASRD